MKYKIVGDSCCDFTAEDLKKEYISRVPLILTVGDTDVIDDDTFDQEERGHSGHRSTISRYFS